MKYDPTFDEVKAETNTEVSKPRRIPCPGRFYRGGTEIETPRTADWWGTKTGVCDWCGERVNLDRHTNAPTPHRVWITIHGTHDPRGCPIPIPFVPFVPADPAVCTCVDPFSNCPTHG
jgi:hypothetical protein